MERRPEIDAEFHEGTPGRPLVVLIHGMGMDLRIWSAPREMKVLAGTYPLSSLLTDRHREMQTIYPELKKRGLSILSWSQSRPAGPLAIGINQGGLFTRVLPGATRPDIQFHIATLSADLAGAKPHPFSGFTLSVCQLRPGSRGHVRIKSADP